MNRPVRMGTAPDEARERILEVAEQHFRRIGYHKTSMADIRLPTRNEHGKYLPLFSLQGCDQRVHLRGGC